MIKTKKRIPRKFKKSLIKNGILIYDVSTLPLNSTMLDIKNRFVNYGLIIWASSKMVNHAGVDCFNEPKVLNSKRKIDIIDVSSCMKNINKQLIKELESKQSKMKEIVWEFEGKEVGRSFIRNKGSYEGERHWLAFRSSVSKYDNYLYVKDGIVQFDANKDIEETERCIKLHGELCGIWSGKQYSKFEIF